MLMLAVMIVMVVTLPIFVANINEGDHRCAHAGIVQIETEFQRIQHLSLPNPDPTLGQVRGWV